MFLVSKPQTGEGKGKEPENCSRSVLQSYSTSFRENAQIEAYLCCQDFKYLGVQYKMVHSVLLPYCKVWHVCTCMILIVC